MTSVPHHDFIPSDRAKTLPASPIRALLSSARGNATLDLGGGIPDPDLFPADALAAVASDVIGRGANSALQYAPTEGMLDLRRFIAERLQRRGCDVDPSRVIITHGSQQALATVAALLTSPTQAVAIEQPVYPGAQQAFVLAQAPTIALPVTSDGWRLDAIADHEFSAMYVIPSHQNPTGRKASAEQRRAIAEFAERTGVFVIEDDAYGELDFDGAPTRPVFADAPTRGILLGTFSKTLCPGLRVGWIVAPEELVEPLVRILQASSLQPGTLAQHLALGLIGRIDWEAHLDGLRRCYERRARSLYECCTALDLRGDLPSGGFFLWVQGHGEASVLAKTAATSGVLVVPEAAFRLSAHPGPDRHWRLAFTRYLDRPSDVECLSRALGRGADVAPAKAMGSISTSSV